jgi:hypothetical protein
MYKGNYYDEEAMKRRRARTLKSAARFIFYIAFIIVIAALIYSRLEVRDLKQEIKDRNVMVEAMRIENQEPSRGGMSDGRDKIIP